MILTMQLTKDFTLEELTRSQTASRMGILNIPIGRPLLALQHLAQVILQPARDGLDIPIYVLSGYRSEYLNKATPGASMKSQHCRGEAADLVCTDNAKLFNWIKENCAFDQLIWEHGDDKQPAWGHVSAVNGYNRREILKAQTIDKKTVYSRL